MTEQLKLSITISNDIPIKEAMNLYEDFISMCKRYDEYIISFATEEFPGWGKGEENVRKE